MITGLLGEVTAEKKRMEVWRMSGNRTSVLFPRKIRTANSARHSRSWQSADLAIGCFRAPASEFIFRIHLSQRRGHLLVCAFRSGGGKTKMSSHRLVLSTFAIVLCLSFSVPAAEKKSKDAKADEAHPLYETAQPTTENLDYTMYQRIRDEGLAHSHVMEFASALADGIGPRLTGSPNLKRANEWTRDQFSAMGCSNAHLEDWGEFGMGWQQLNTWVRMTAPDTAVFIAQAAPWSPATNGAINAPAIWMDIKDAKDLDQYKGKLAGKIVLYGAMRDVPPVDKPLWDRNTDQQLEEIAEIPVNGGGGGHH